MEQSVPYVTEQDRMQAMQTEKTQLSRVLTEVQETERRRLGAILHDDLGQYIVALRAQIKTLHLLAERPDQVQRVAQELEQQAHRIQQGFRAVVQGMYPVQLECLSVFQLLMLLKQRWFDQVALHINLHPLGALPELSLADKQQLYRLLQEALCNAYQHGQATQVKLWLQYKAQAWRILLRDNGKGGLLAQAGIGCYTMTERAQSMRAQLYIRPRVMRGWSVYLYVH